MAVLLKNIFLLPDKYFGPFRCDYDGRPLRTETGTDRSRSQRLGRGSGHIGAFRAQSGNMSPSPSHTKFTRGV